LASDYFSSLGENITFNNIHRI